MATRSRHRRPPRTDVGTGRRRRRDTGGEHTDDTARARILDAAEALIAQRGFDATPTAAIAAQADVPKGLVFYYFPTKDDILVALLDERMQADPVADPDALVVPGDPVRTLLAWEAGLGLDTHVSSVLRIIVWREADTHPRVREHLHALNSALRAQISRLLHASVAEPVDTARVDAAAAAWVAYIVSRANTKRWWQADRPDIQNGATSKSAGNGTGTDTGKSSGAADDRESTAVAELLAAGLATA